MDIFIKWYIDLSADKREEANVLLLDVMKQVDLPKTRISLPDEPLRSRMKASIIGTRGSKINALKSGTGSNIVVKDDHVLIVGGLIEEAIKSVKEIMANTVCVYPHPGGILNCFGKDGSYKLNVFSQIQGQTTYRFNTVANEVSTSLSGEQSSSSLHYIYDRSLLEKIPPGPRKICTYIGSVTFYDANRSQTLSSEILDKIWCYESFKGLRIGYGKDIKSTWEGRINVSPNFEQLELLKEAEETITCCVSISHRKWFIIKDSSDGRIIKDAQQVYLYYNIILPHQTYDVRINAYSPTTCHDIDLQPDDLIVRYQLIKRKQIYLDKEKGIICKRYTFQEGDRAYYKIRLSTVNKQPTLDEVTALVEYTIALAH